MKPYRCSVPYCKNTGADQFLKFYSLPYRDPEACKEWMRLIGNHSTSFKQQMENPHLSIKICEIHFSYTCKTGFNSQLHDGSLPTLHLPIVGPKKPKMNYLAPQYRPLGPALTSYCNETYPEQDSLITKCKEAAIELQVETCSEVCRFCYRKGILYDIETSLYKTTVQFVTIIKSLVPDYSLNSSNLQENICLNCAKLLLTSYLTLNRIKSATKVFSIMLEPLNNKSLPKRIVKVSYPHEFNMRSVLYDCSLKISVESNKTYLSEKFAAMEPNSVDVPRPILEDIKSEVDTLSIDLPVDTCTAEQLSEITATPNHLSDIISTKNDLDEISSVSKDLSVSYQLLSKQSDVPDSIFGMTLDDHNYNEIKRKIYDNVDTVKKRKIYDRVDNVKSAPLIKIVKLDLSKLNPLTQRLVKLPTPKLLKRLSTLTKLPRKPEFKITAKKMADLTDASTELTETIKMSTKQSKTPKETSMSQETSMTDVVGTSQRMLELKVANIQKTTEKASALSTDMSKKQLDVVKKNRRTEVDKPNLDSCALKQYGNKRKLLVANVNDQKIINDDNVNVKCTEKIEDSSEDDINDGNEDEAFLTEENSTDNYLEQNESDKQTLITTEMPIDDSADCSFKCLEISCEFIGETIEAYVEHLRLHKKRKPGNRICLVCKAVCVGFEEYYRHCQNHKKDKRMKEMSERTFQCPQCDVIKSNSSYLRHHVKVKHGPFNECPTCHKQIRQYYLARHIRNHDKNKPKLLKRCEECNLSFDKLKLLCQHQLKEHPKLCLICGKKITDIPRLRQHMKSHDIYEENVECKFCHRIFRGDRALRRHLQYRATNKTCALSKKERDKRSIKRASKMCQVCGKLVKSFSSHMLSHSTVNRYKCDLCTYETNNGFLFRNHKLTHSGDKPFLCANCGKSFIQKYMFDMHLKQHVISAEPIKCKYCEETFPTKHEYVVHKQTHGIADTYGRRIKRPYSRRNKSTTNMEKKFCCLHCNKTIKSATRLREHIIEQHDKIKGYFACFRCDMRFDTRCLLSSHTAIEHVRRPELTCSVCKKAFKSKSMIQQHMQVHTGERPFNCELCSSKFKTASNLYVHKKFVHEDMRPFSCEVCKKAFRTMPSLKEHARTHTGERLKCAHCDKTFAGGSNRSKHMREVHNIRSYSRAN